MRHPRSANNPIEENNLAASPPRQFSNKEETCWIRNYWHAQGSINVLGQYDPASGTQMSQQKSSKMRMNLGLARSIISLDAGDRIVEINGRDKLVANMHSKENGYSEIAIARTVVHTFLWPALSISTGNLPVPLRYRPCQVSMPCHGRMSCRCPRPFGHYHRVSCRHYYHSDNLWQVQHPPIS